MALDILELRKLCIPKNIRITLHAAKRLEQRGIFLKDVISCIMNGEIIEQYPDDYPYPSCLILGMSIEDKYLHVVIVTIFSNIDAVEQYFAFGRVIQTAKQLYEGCFAAAVHSHNCETAAHFELHVHMAECIRFTAGIFERHITKFNIILNIAALLGGEAALIHCVRSIQKLKHCVKET